MKLISYLLLIITFMVTIVFALFFWLNAIADSYFYWAIGKFFQTGTYPFVAPFIYDRPTTISPPAYGILLILLQSFTRPDIILHLLQLLLLTLTSYFIYQILRSQIAKHLALTAACLHFLIPGNLIYTSYALTETISQFFITFFLYFIWQYTLRGKHFSLGLAVFIGLTMPLWKYSLIVYGLTALIIFFFRRPSRLRSYLLPSLGLLTLITWIFINYQITGVFGLSDARGIQLWNQAVWVGKILPQESHPAMKNLRQFVPNNENLYRAYWDIQMYILPKTNNSWQTVDNTLGNVALAAIKTHPISYLTNTLHIFWQLHTGGIPYWDNLWYFGETSPTQPLFCEQYGSIKFCEPLIKTPYSFTIWNSFVRLSNQFYKYIFPVIIVVFFFPSLVLLFLKPKFRIFPFLYLLGTLPIAMYVHPDPRYILPFYPFIIICIFLAPQALRRKNTAPPPPSTTMAIINKTGSSTAK